MKRFAITGVGGFVAPRHLQAIEAHGGEVVAALDPHDSVGILDRYGHDIAFFTETERFERHLEKLSRTKEAVDYLVVCSPNHLHDAHVRMGLHTGCHVICEKPLVLNPENLDTLRDIERETKRRVKTILQLRYHPEVEKIRTVVRNAGEVRDHTVTTADLTYVTPRGRWYQHSWKGDDEKSGGLITNIGVHMFDLLLYIFGAAAPDPHYYVKSQSSMTAEGRVYLKYGNCSWKLSVDGKRPARRLQIRLNTGEFHEIELSKGFTDAHVKVYEEILAGRGFGIEDARAAVELCWKLRKK